MANPGWGESTTIRQVICDLFDDLRSPDAELQEDAAMNIKLLAERGLKPGLMETNTKIIEIR